MPTSKYFEYDYQRNHNYQWALSMAKQGHHLVCSRFTNGERLVYTTKPSIRTYDEEGMTLTERPVTHEDKMCNTWAMWQYQNDENPEDL